MPDHLANADLVMVMDLENLDRLRKEFPAIADRTTLLGLFRTPGTLSIADPYFASEAAANRICEQVRTAIEGLAAWVVRAKLSTSTLAVPSAAASSR
jgi:protein-tyrosine-phosphatase